MKIIVIRFVLADATSSKAIGSMVRIRVLAWLVTDAATFPLATEIEVTLQSIHVKEPFSIKVGIAFGCDVKKLKGRPLPKVIAAVN